MFRVRQSSDAQPPERRFAWWRELNNSQLLRLDIDSDQRDDFRAEVSSWQTEDLRFSMLSHSGVRVRRTAGHVRQHDPGFLYASLRVRGSARIIHRRQDSVLRPGEILLYHSSSPFESWSGTRRTASEHINIGVPEEFLPVPVGRLDHVLGRRLPADTPSGSLLVAFLRQMAADTVRWREEDGAWLASITAELFTVWLRHIAGDDVEPGAAAGGGRRSLLAVQIRSFIEERLDDPLLSPAMVAAAHHISLRQLHRVFQEQDETVASVIRRRRLEQARRDLADPVLRDEAITAVGARWGYGPAQFSRAFRAAFGASPREFRSAALRRAAPGAGC